MIKHFLSCSPINDSSCAEIQVSNPSSGSNRTFTLKVDVENGELGKIYWPNGGWLNDYYATFINDKGYEYQDWLLDESNCNL